MTRVPGSNLLDDALSLIDTTPLTYYQYLGRTTNAIGLDVASYAPGVPITASVQAVPRSHYQQMGLDYSKTYIMIWSSANLTDLGRGRAGDQVGFNGQRYELKDEADWTPIDGWNSVLAIRVADDP